MTSVFDIRDYGAACEEGVVSTQPIQDAIDACNKAGGGTVYCPPGVFVTGTIWLKSFVTLHLEAGCTLLASPRRADYQENLPFPESVAFTQERTCDAHLVVAYRAQKTAITGSGVIDGNSKAFMPFLADDQAAKQLPREWDWRPGQMLFFCRCRDVWVDQVELNNSPYWTLFLHGCENVRIHGVSITNPQRTPNGDGIDVDCCRDVTIDSCLISSGDDCVTLRGYAGPLGDAAQPCENVTVTNSVLHTRCNAIRVGVGNGVIRNCAFSNIVIRRSTVGVNVISRYSGTTRGVDIRHVRFGNMRIEAKMPIYVSTGANGEAPVADVTFSDIDATGSAPCFIGGTPDNPIRRVSISDLNLTVRGGQQNTPPEEAFSGNPEWTFHGMGAPYGLCVAEAQDILLQNVRVRWEDVTGLWQHAVFARNTAGLVLSNVDAAWPPTGGDGASAIRCVRCADVLVRACRAGRDTGQFLNISQSPPNAVARLIGNDFSNARHPFVCDARVLEAGNIHPPDRDA